jgi:hypothetical protein
MYPVFLSSDGFDPTYRILDKQKGRAFPPPAFIWPASRTSMPLAGTDYLKNNITDNTIIDQFRIFSEV